MPIDTKAAVAQSVGEIKTTLTALGERIDDLAGALLVAIEAATAPEPKPVPTPEPVTPPVIAASPASIPDHAVTHPAPFGVGAASSVVRAWIDALPNGAVGGLPGGPNTWSLIWTAKSPYPDRGEAGAIRLVSLDPAKPAIFTKPDAFKFEPAGISADLNHPSKGGLILDGFWADYSGLKIADKEDPTGRRFAEGFKPQCITGFLDNLLVTRWKFLDCYDCVGIWGKNSGVSNCEAIRTDCDFIYGYFGKGPYYFGFNHAHHWARSKYNKEHSDFMQITLHNYNRAGVVSLVVEGNKNDLSSAPDMYVQGIYLDNEAVAGSGQGVFVEGRDYFHGALHVKGNHLIGTHPYGIGIRGWKNAVIAENYIEGLDAATGYTGTSVGYIGPVGGTSIVDAHHGRGEVRDNCVPLNLQRASFKFPKDRYALVSNIESNYNVTTHRNGSKRPPRWVEGRAGNLTGGVMSFPMSLVPTI